MGVGNREELEGRALEEKREWKPQWSCKINK